MPQHSDWNFVPQLLAFYSSKQLYDVEINTILQTFSDLLSLRVNTVFEFKPNSEALTHRFRTATHTENSNY